MPPASVNMEGPPPLRLRFRRAQRLVHSRQFEAVYDAKVRKSSGAVTVFVRPNMVGTARLGLSVGRRVGPAVTRNRVKRRLREAFRHIQHQLPAPSLEQFAGGAPLSWRDPDPSIKPGAPAYDLVVAVTRDEDVKPTEYAQRLLECVNAAHRVWCKRLGEAHG